MDNRENVDIQTWMFKRQIISCHRNQLLDILEATEVFANYSIRFDFLKLFDFEPELGYRVLDDPLRAISECDLALIQAQKSILEDESDNPRRTLTLKPNIHARFDLPFCPEIHRSTIPKNEDLGCFIKITGTAVRLTQSKMLEYRKDYKCVKCQYVQSVEGKYENRFVIKAPLKCTNPETPRCRSTTFNAIHNISRDNCRDYQEMKLQEQVNKFTVGGIPGSIWVTLDDDLVDCCKPGDDVSISGIVMKRWFPLILNKKCEVELVIKANYVEVCNSQKSISFSVGSGIQHNFNQFWMSYKNYPMKGRDVILASICPKVYGLYMVKLALALTVITGCNHNFQTDEAAMKNLPSDDKSYESSVRGQCHLLLVGDPGTGKSQLLKAAAVLTPRSVLTSGSGSTKAGLTCTALREDGEWQLEAGALVLADGGTCCIDELAQMKEHDRASIHEAMEQQTISVAKAGIVCKLNSRCAVVAACNPKGNYDIDQSLSMNVSLGTPLLSRFDLIFILLDKKNEDWDNALADYILFGKESNNVHVRNWHLEKLQTYLSLVGGYQVKVTPSATAILQAYYMSQRRAINRDPSRTTVRMLDSLIRLSQAHARLMFRKIVLPMDAITAVSLMDLSMQDCLYPGSSNAIQTSFHEYPDFNYLKTAKIYLLILELHSIWENELLFYAQLLQTDKQTLDYSIENYSFDLFKHANNMSVDHEIENVIESTYFKSETDDILKNDFFHKDKYFDNDKSGVKKENITDPNISLENLLSDESIIESSEILIKANHSTDSVRSEKENVMNKSKSKVKFNLNSSDDKIETSIINSPKRRKRNFSPKTSKIKKNSSVIEENDVESSVNDFQLLNCLPSVNDIYKELNISFDIGNDDLSDEKLPETNNEVTITKNNKEKCLQQNSSNKKTTFTEKLHKFSFSGKGNKSENQNLTISSSNNEQSHLEKVSVLNNSLNNQISNNLNTSPNIESTKNTNTDESSNIFRSSIFESGENFDDFDL